ncbi:MAG: hypothetical protein MZW92_80830 [Comamonadaceae bacterium]|nr:hypothetical protein [Comamonadaceae bacterium]
MKPQPGAAPALQAPRARAVVARLRTTGGALLDVLERLPTLLNSRLEKLLPHREACG